ncbi:hypothetical protein OG948_30050 [Embleya sp. NBC_00888]|uniref:hypothetical protein n=1 Tax=Embleya sp. NBC_00888 TaxID=2975960 RepID=UPI003864637E|nr:hypothetical protein OG948_30050 [Embleya sp. NBC_00888]
MPRRRPNVPARRGTVQLSALALLAAAGCAACGDTAAAAPDRAVTGYTDGVVSATVPWQGRSISFEVAVGVTTSPEPPRITDRLPRVGTAPKGTMFVLIGLHAALRPTALPGSGSGSVPDSASASASGADPADCTFAYGHKLADEVVLRLPDGRRVPVLNASPQPDLYAASVELAFQVPESFRTGTLALTPTGTLRAACPTGATDIPLTFPTHHFTLKAD